MIVCYRNAIEAQKQACLIIINTSSFRQLKADINENNSNTHRSSPLDTALTKVERNAGRLSPALVVATALFGIAPLDVNMTLEVVLSVKSNRDRCRAALDLRFSLDAVIDRDRYYASLQSMQLNINWTSISYT